MRIISGMLGGRRFNPPFKMPHTRPTTDFAKEGLFNILSHNLEFEKIKSLDLFGGTGNISYELASRGVKDLTVVEKDTAMVAFIKKTARELGIKNLKTRKADVFRFIDSCTETYDFIFAGPPYDLADIDELPELVFGKRLLNKNGWFVLEHTPRNNYKEFPFFTSERIYGTTVFSLFIEKRG